MQDEQKDVHICSTTEPKHELGCVQETTFLVIAK